MVKMTKNSAVGGLLEPNKDTLVKALQLIGAGMNQKCMKKNKRKKLILFSQCLGG